MSKTQVDNYLTNYLNELEQFCENKLNNPTRDMIDFYLPENVKITLRFAHSCAVLKLTSLKNQLICDERNPTEIYIDSKLLFEEFCKLYADECYNFDRFSHMSQQLVTSSGEIHDKLLEVYTDKFMKMDGHFDTKMDKETQTALEKTLKVVNMLKRENLELFTQELNKAEARFKTMPKKEQICTCSAKEASFVLLNSGISKEIVDDFIINAMIVDKFVIEQRRINSTKPNDETEQQFLRNGYEKLVKQTQETEERRKKYEATDRQQLRNKLKQMQQERKQQH